MQKRRRVAGQHRYQQVKIVITVKSAFKIFRNESYRIFAIAILASLAWHLFWLSTIAIVARPDSGHNVKFSKVSFLGPLLGKGAMELQARPKERSFLEMRYLNRVSSSLVRPAEKISSEALRYENGNDTYHLRDERMTAAIDDALGREKPHPPDVE